MQILATKVLENLKTQLRISNELSVGSEAAEGMLESTYIGATDELNRITIDELNEIYEDGLPKYKMDFMFRTILLGKAAALLNKYGLEYDEYVKWANKQDFKIRPYLLGLVGIEDKEGIDAAQKLELDELLQTEKKCSILIEDQKPQDDSVFFKVLDKYIVVDKNVVLYEKISKMVTAEALRQRKIFSQRFDAEIKSFDEVMTKLPGIVADCIQSVLVKSLRALRAEGLKSYDISEFLQENYKDFDFYKYFKPYEDVCKTLADMEGEIEYKKELNSITRGQWIGGGVGLSGMIKGAVMAQAMNAGNAAMHSVTASLTAMHESNKLKRRKERAFRNPEFKSYFEVGIVDCCTGIQYGLFRLLRRNKILEGPYWGIAVDYVEDVIKKSPLVTEDDYKTWVYKYIQSNPSSASLYETIYKKYGSKCGEIEAMTRFFMVNGLQISKAVNDEYLKSVRALPENTIEAAVSKAEQFDTIVRTHNLLFIDDENKYHKHIADKRILQEALWGNDFNAVFQAIKENSYFANRLLVEYCKQTQDISSIEKYFKDVPKLKELVQALRLYYGVGVESNPVKAKATLEKLSNQNILIAKVEYADIEKNNISYGELYPAVKEWDPIAIKLIKTVDVPIDEMPYVAWLESIEANLQVEVNPSSEYLYRKQVQERRDEFYQKYKRTLDYFSSEKSKTYYDNLRQEGTDALLKAALSGDFNAGYLYVNQVLNNAYDDESGVSANRLIKNLEIIFIKHKDPIVLYLYLGVLAREKSANKDAIPKLCTELAENGNMYAVMQQTRYTSNRYFGMHWDEALLEKNMDLLLTQGVIAVADEYADLYMMGIGPFVKDDVIASSLLKVASCVRTLSRKENDFLKKHRQFLWDDNVKTSDSFFPKKEYDQNLYNDLSRILTVDFNDSVRDSNTESLGDNKELLGIKLIGLVEKVADKYAADGHLISLKSELLQKIHGEKQRALMSRMLDRAVEERLSKVIQEAREYGQCKDEHNTLILGAIFIIIIGLIIKIFFFSKALIISIIIAVLGLIGDESRKKMKRLERSKEIVMQYEQAGYHFESK